ncbi:MAG: type III pantothenate kinase [Chitinispirillaceae bacterium]|jgi:type III pantothenate kinase
MSDRVIAVDIGSTRVHAGIVDTGKRKPACLFRIDFPLSEMSRRLPKAFGKVKINVPAIIAGGRKGYAKNTAGILKGCGVVSITGLKWLPSLPVRFNYDRPETLGADRIADALYAVTVYPERNVIIIDSGTAITVDAVSSKAEFMGGAILAGIETQLRGLHAATDTLPMVEIPGRKIPFLGGSTIQCIQAGTTHGTAGALNHLVCKYRTLLGGKSIVLATGGGWHVTKKLVDFKFIEVPDMTLIGTALYIRF